VNTDGIAISPREGYNQVDDQSPQGSKILQYLIFVYPILICTCPQVKEFSSILQPKYLSFTVISAHAVGIHKDKYQPASVYTYNVQATWSKDFKAGHLKNRIS
jgi:hypothetical protein